MSLTDGLIAYYNMSGLLDSSGNSYTLTNNGATLTSGGKLGSAYSFSDTNSMVTSSFSNSISGTSDVSLSFWVNWQNNNPSSLNYDWMFVAGNSANQNDYSLAVLNGVGANLVIFTGSGSSTSNTGSIPITVDNNFHYYVITKSNGGTTIKLYEDSVLVTTRTITAMSNSISDKFRIYGNLNGGNTLDLIHVIDEVSIYNRVLSQQEITQLYNFGIGLSYPFNTSNLVKQYNSLFTGLVAGYDFKGDAKDFSGNDYDGVVSGATLTSNRFGISNSAYSFNGSSDYVNTGFSSNQLNLTNQVTFSAWVYSTKSTTGGQLQGIIDNDISSNRGSVLLAENDYFNFIVLNTSSVQKSATYPVIMNQWVHLVGTYDGSNVKLYINGNLVSTTAQSGNIRLNSTIYHIGHGQYDTGSYRYFGGKIALPLIYNRGLSDGEVKQLYDLTKSKFLYPFPQHRQGGLSE